ncbi:hypothetical protein [Mycolicibacter algericus]|uniref:hypothetical protein n=1 Tax=Mycolicibacter algericus TaxID=1288388 RepID=UPI003C77A97F
MTHLEWLCDLDLGFAAPVGLLSAAFSARVGDLDVTVHLPSLPTDPDAWYLAQPKVWGAAEPSDQWGMVLQRRAGKAEAITVSRLLLTAKVAGSEAEIHEAAQAIHGEREAWVSNLQTWLEIVTGQHLTPIGHPRTQLIGGPPIWYVSTDRSENKPITFPGTINITYPPPLIPAVTAELLAGCLCLAPQAQPDLAWILLRDARSLAAAGQHRRAVIDAATAAELAITRMMDALLKNFDSGKREALRRKHQTLGSKIALLTKHGQPLADNLYENLVARRNDAVHEGRAIGAGHCDAAIAAAAAVVELEYPLPAVLGGRRWPVQNSIDGKERDATGEVRTN